ncbi:MAG: hypothetical protein HC819_09410 [Cyclobacteriaceae bacterium]|nr:hypothetical protein [Cyclobacteriaceae bacterium]
MPNGGTIESIALSIARLFQPLEEEFKKGRIRVLLAELGMEFPPELETKAAFINALQKGVSDATLLPKHISDLIKAIEDEDFGKITNTGKSLFGTIKSLITNIDKIATELKNLGGSLPGISAGQLTTFANNLPKNLLDYLIVKNLEGTPGLVEPFEFIDLIERTTVIDGDYSYTTRNIKFDQFTNFISNPQAHLQTLYGWGSSGFTGVAMLEKLEKLFNSSGVPAVLDKSVNPNVLDLIFLEVKPNLALDPKGLSLILQDKITIDKSAPFAMDDWRIEIGIDADLSASLQIDVQPNGKVTFKPPSGKIEGEAFVKWVAGKISGEPYLLLGEANGSRLEVREFNTKASVGFKFDSASNKSDGEFKVGGEILGGKIVIDFSQGDGFLSELLSGFGLESDFDVGIGFSSKEGVFFYGSSTLEIQLPTHIEIGPIELSALTLSVGLEGSKFPIGITSNIKAELGPLVAVVEQMGIKADLSLPSDRSGNLGPVDLAMGFQPPKGVGLSLDAGIIKGGGYLFLDYEKGEYAGALEFTFSEIVSLKAIGIITTKMPDGSDGFSMLIIITAEFGAGIQLGFGFKLMGVGGLMGLNRTMKLEKIAEGVRDGGINSIMFPQDVVANAQKIISDLKTYFPVKEGTFLIGPMAKLGWGTPTLISVSLGIIIEIPGNIAILGVIKIALPDEDAALLVLQVNFIGAIEFDKERLWFFASMFGSRVLFITIDGEMGLLIAWGNSAEFVSSIGGFHPVFNPPALPFPNPVRLSFNILNESWAKVRVMGYFAVTSNTVQFGARVEIYFGFSVLSVDGHIGFDALFQFSPFYFIISLSASFSVKVFGAGIFSVKVKMSLEGPTPWRAKGTGSISILFWDIEVDFDETWGDKKNTTLPPIQVMPLVKAEYEKLENWKALLPAGSNLLVSLRPLEESDALVLHPVGTLNISQRAIPLDITLDKVGAQKPNDAKKFRLDTTGSTVSKVKDLTENFPLAQFQEMDNNKKLSRPSFEHEHSGVELAVKDKSTAIGKAVKRIVRYETIIIDNNFKRHVIRFFEFFNVLFQHFMHNNAVAKSSLSYKTKKQFVPFDDTIKVNAPGYSVAFTANNTAFAAETVSFQSEALAMEFMHNTLATSPNMVDDLHVIPTNELNQVA